MLTTIHILLLLFCKTIDYVTAFSSYDTSYILEYIKKRAYPIEVHNVKTQDGFVLTIHRIPHGIVNGAGESRKGVVLLNHGLEESAEHWIINGNKSLAFLLPDEGYDVWMMNARGTYHSTYHAKYGKTDSRYWNFSWHEIGIYDLPAVIDHILMETKVSNISYIGHSQGCTSFFVLTSEKPEYNEKFNIMIGLAPAIYMKHVTNPVFRTLSNFWELVYPNKGLLDNTFINVLVQSLCQNQLAMQTICTNALFFFGGYDYEQLDDSVMLEVTRSAPAGASTKQLIHYVQLVRSGHFRKYDYLTMENLKRYGMTAPPDYDLSKVTANIALYYAKNDRLSVPTDVKKLIAELTNANVVVDKLIDFELFTHFDFLFAKDVVPLIYNNLIKTLNDYN